MSKPRVGYWNIRGVMTIRKNEFSTVYKCFITFMFQFAQPIRLLLAYTGTDFEDIRYNYIPVGDGTWDRSEWLNVKTTLDLDFPNVQNYLLSVKFTIFIIMM